MNSSVHGTECYHVRNTHGNTMVQFVSGGNNMLLLGNMSELLFELFLYEFGPLLVLNMTNDWYVILFTASGDK